MRWRDFSGSGTLSSFHPPPLFSSPSPAARAPSQSRSAESEPGELERLGLTFYCSSHLSQGNSLETPVIGEWCLLSWSPQIVTGKAWETVIHPASSVLWRLWLKGPFRLPGRWPIEPPATFPKMPFLPCSFLLALMAPPTPPHLSTCWTHTHTDTAFIRMYLRTKVQESDGRVSPFSTFLCPSFLTSSGCDEDDMVSSVSSACCRACCQCSVNTRSCPCDGLILRFHPLGSGYLGPWDFKYGAVERAAQTEPHFRVWAAGKENAAGLPLCSHTSSSPERAWGLSGNGL